MCTSLIYYYYCYSSLSSPQLPCREQISKGGGPSGFGETIEQLLDLARLEEAMVVWPGRRGLGEVALGMEVEHGAGIA